MRRAANHSPTVPGCSAKLKQLAASYPSNRLVRQPPSALVYPSYHIGPSSSRALSTKKATKAVSWPTEREHSWSKNAQKKTKADDGRLGQEEGQRLIEAAFLSKADTTTNALSKKGTPPEFESKRKNKSSGAPGSSATVQPPNKLQRTDDVQRSSSSGSKARKALDHKTEPLLRGIHNPGAEHGIRRKESVPSPPIRSQQSHISNSQPGVSIKPVRRLSSNDLAPKSTNLAPVQQNPRGPGVQVSATAAVIRSRSRRSSKYSSLPTPISRNSNTLGKPNTCRRELKARSTLGQKPPRNVAFLNKGSSAWDQPEVRSGQTPIQTQLGRSAVANGYKPSIAFGQSPAPPQLPHLSGLSREPWAWDRLKQSDISTNELAPFMSSQSYEWDAEGLQKLDYLGALLFKKSTTSSLSASPLVRQRDRPSLLTEIRKRSRNLPVLQDANALQMRPDDAPRSSNSHALPDHGQAALEAPSSSWPKHQPSEISDWENLARHLQHERGAEATWEAMSPLAKEGCHLLAHPNAGLLRDAFLEAAVGDDVRLNEFVGVANALRDRLGYEWPDLYGNVLYKLLDAAEPGRAMLWHSRLYSLFTPSQTVFAALLSHFVVDESPEMQNTLIKLHDSSKAFGLYDTVIARLFNFGQSKTARAWRKRLLSYNDFPLTEASVPFLRFLSAYYPLLQLTAEEREILKPRTGVPTDVKTRSEAELEEIRKSVHGDHIVAKWFASTWTTVEFAIDLIHRFGVTNLGPLALQALGLRDPGAKNLAEHLTQLESLGVALAPMTYCRIIAHFARQGDDDLLHGILTCDIHPDEFEDIETVRMLAVSAENQRDAAQHRLMRAIETAMQTISTPDDYDEPSLSEDLGSFQSALTPAQGDSAENLDLTFDRLGYHPRRWLRRRAAETSRLDQAVVALRQAFADDVPIPLDYWKRLLYNYGRLGRLKSLEQLGLELVEMYGPANARRIPIYHKDFPASAFSHDPKCGPDPSKSLDSESQTDGLELWQQALDGRATGVQEILYIPADLPFSHRQHPIQKIFHQRLQRNIIRWGFDLALRATHAFNGPSWRRGGISNSAWRATQLPVRGVAQGLRVLARLRDVGVLIDPQIVQSEIVRRVVAADFPGRGQAPWVDHHELDLAYIVRFVNKVWGPGVFESAEDLGYLIRARENKIREHYWKSRSSKGDLLVQQMEEDVTVADV